MTPSFDVARPALAASARFRLRSDGSAGVYDSTTGIGLEVAPDQARLLALLDGQRTLGEVMEANYAAHRSMPLAALDDLLASLTAHGMLLGSAVSRPRPRTWLSFWLAPRNVWRAAVPGLGVLSLLLVAALPAIAVT